MKECRRSSVASWWWEERDARAETPLRINIFFDEQFCFNANSAASDSVSLQSPSSNPGIATPSVVAKRFSWGRQDLKLSNVVLLCYNNGHTTKLIGSRSCLEVHDWGHLNHAQVYKLCSGRQCRFKRRFNYLLLLRQNII